ncbi:oligosaccharide flippase family protein [Natronococcus wangiae]|uniref:oligosaccharide flippase family protein n=1 Tax=Natronococcus wangiae TaxID=3068275 RepID=UPI00387E6F16
MVAQYLSPEYYGYISIGFTIFSISTVLLLLGFQEGLRRNIPQIDSIEDIRNMIHMSFYSSLLLSILYPIIIYILSSKIAANVFNDSNLTPILQVFALTIPLFVLLKLSVGALQGLKNTRYKVASQNILLPGVRFVGILLVAFLISGNYITIAWAYFISYLMASMISIYYLNKDIKPLPFTYNKKF